MKKFLILAFAMSLLLPTMAGVRTAEEAARIAQQYMVAPVGKHPMVAAQGAPLLHTINQPQSEDPAAYIFRRGENAGYVMISADDRARTLLAYTNEGEFDADNMPENMRVWMQHYAEEIASLQGQKGTVAADDRYAVQAQPVPSQQTIAKTAIAPRQILTATAVSPILGSLKWDQSEPFNNLCPTDPDDSRYKCYTGCVATAVSQVMRAWEHPTKGTGSHSYQWKYGNRTISADFSNVTFDWANMRLDYNGTYTTTEANAVAQLMYNVGVSCDMNYGGATKGGSGTSTELAAQAMQKYFGYGNTMTALRPDYMGQKAFEAEVAAELQAGRPVLMSGSTKNNEGHCFVCDGMDVNGYAHINWGWGGYQDNYFALSALDPEKQGIGGAASGEGYNVRVLGIVGIAPDKGLHFPCQLGLQNISANKTSLSQGDRITITLNRLINIGINDWEGGNFCVAIYNESGSYVGQIDDDLSLSELPTNYYYEELTFSGSFPTNLSDGKYVIRPIFWDNDKWNAVECVYTLYCTVSGKKVTIEAVHADQSISDPEPDIPTDEELKAYYNPGQLCVCVYFEGEVCNDIVFTGTYNNWSDDATKCQKFVPVQNHEGWYVVAVTDNSAVIEGKPVQLRQDGTFSWQYQTGAMWVCLRGSVQFVPSYGGEMDLKNYSTATPVVLQSGGWKTDVCGIKTQDYTVYLKAPKCDLADMKPAIVGSFNNWSNTPMNYDAKTDRYYVTVTADEGSEYKFREQNNYDWTNEILIWNSTESKWYTTGNRTFGTETTISIDYSDGIWSGCMKDYTPFNLSATTTDGSHYQFRWEAEDEPDFYYVALYVNENLYQDTIVSTPSVALRLMNATTYTWEVYSIVNYEYVAMATGANITVSAAAVTQYAASDLQVTTQGKTISFTWSGTANIYEVRLWASDGETTLQQADVWNAHTYHFDVESDGYYAVSVRSVSDGNTYYVGSMIYEWVTIDTKTTDLNRTEAEQNAVYYDLFGRKLNGRPGSGVYIQRVNGQTQTIVNQ